MARRSEDRLVSRLLWLTIVLIAAGAVLTLAGQPPSFWNFPGTAIRFDGLPIHSSTNPMYDFLLGRGWPAYLAGVATFGAVAWLLVAVLPRRLALVAELTVILGLGFSESNWIVVRWHGGAAGAVIYLAALAIALAAAVMPAVGDDNHKGLRRLRWAMAVATTVDCVFTLIGQPASYWHNTAAVHESNAVSRYFLEQGWWAFSAYLLAEIAATWLFVVRIPPAAGWAVTFYIALSGFAGGSNWLFYEWRLGLQAPILYGLVLSIMVVWQVFQSSQGTVPDESLVDASL